MAVFAMTLSVRGGTLPSSVVTRLESEKKPVCRIAYDRGKPYFDIGGRRYEAALYNASQFWNGSNQRLRKQVGYFRDAGMHLYGLGVNTPDAWKPDGTIDFELALRSIKSALELDPDAYFLYSINTVLPPRWWVERNPDELVGYANGKVSIDERECMRNCAAGSAASAIWRRDICDFQRRLVEHIESTPYANRIFAYRVDWGVNHEWHYYGMFGYMPDNGKSMTVAFRNWLRKSYGGDVGALRAAWRDDKVTFETAETPSAEMRRRKSAAPLRDPVLDRAVIDYERCHAEVLRDFLLESNRSVKEACGGRALVGNYGGYYFGVSAPAEGWHLENDAVLDSPYVDFQCSPQIYGEEARRLGAGQYARCLLEGLRRRGKLSIQEADKATSTSGSRYSRWTDNREEDLALLARDFVQTLCWGCGFWYFDFGYGFYADPIYADYFRRIYEIWREQADCTSISEVLVVGDYESVMFSHVDWPATERGELITRQVNALANAGVPFDSASFKDLASGTLRDYKVYILPNFNHVTPEKAAVIEQIRKRGGKVVIVDEKPLTREELLALFRAAGVHVYCDEEDSAVYACASYIGFHCAKSGRKTIHLPHPAKVVQIYPERRQMGAVKVLSFEASGASTFLFRVERGETARMLHLEWTAGGAQPVETIDLGPQTEGGYAVFNVKSFRPAGTTKEGKPVGFPVLRLAYAAHPDGLAPTGDFTRKDCVHYLGMDVDNPVLPANVNRFETYTIARTGTFVAPLVQGLQRYVRVQLDTPGTAVDIDSFEIRNVGVHDETKPVGSFKCSDERLNRTWAMGVRTCQMAAIPNNDAWRAVAGKLLPRKLERSAPAGFCATSRWSGDGTIETAFELRENPHYDSAMGLMFHAADADNGLIVVVSQPSFCRVLERRNGVNRQLWQTVLSEPLIDGVPHTLAAKMKGAALEVSLDGVKVADVNVGEASGDKFGFYTEKEWWPVVSSVAVRNAEGEEIFRDDFSAADSEGRLPGWDYSKAFRFLADGGKRDRLVWSGDLWWAARTCFTAFGPEWPYFRESLRLLAFNQTPEGYIQAAPYAENARRPASGEYGHFPSDEFSAWFVPCLWEYYLHTADRKTADELYPNMAKDIDYLSSHCREDGIFEQRRETSCHAWSMNPGDVKYRLYMNLVLWLAYHDGAALACELGHDADADRWTKRQELLAKAIRETFRDSETGEYVDVMGRKGLNHIARGMALASGFATKAEALSFGRMPPPGVASKFLLLPVRGKLKYGFAESAFGLMEYGTWFELSDPKWEGAQCDSECGYLIRDGFYDEAHPDTTATGDITTYFLGVEPTAPGYRRFRFSPRFISRLTFAEGSVPTPHGFIRARWDVAGDKATCRLSVPAGTEADVVLPGVSKMLGPGEHVVEAVGIKASLVDPTITSVSYGGMKAVEVENYVSHIYGNRDAVFEYIADLGDVRDVRGVEIEVGDLKLAPSSVAIETAVDPGAFTRQKEQGAIKWESLPDSTLKIDMRTVGGALQARYVRFAFTDVPPSWQKSLKTHYRVSLKRLRVVYGED